MALPRQYLLLPIAILTLLGILTAIHLIFTRQTDFRPLPNPLESEMATSLKHLKVAPKEAHTATVIFLHVSAYLAGER